MLQDFAQNENKSQIDTTQSLGLYNPTVAFEIERHEVAQGSMRQLCQMGVDPKTTYTDHNNFRAPPRLTSFFWRLGIKLPNFMASSQICQV